MPLSVHHGADKSYLPGITGFNTSQFASSIHGVQARIAHALNQPITYDDLICLGGFAFRIGIHPALCPSAANPACGYNCINPALSALPWNMRTFFDFPWNGPKHNRPAFEAEARAAIKQSIDRGIPVHYGAEEDGLIIGYADEGRRWWCIHPYHKNGTEPFWHDEVAGFAGGKWPWGIAIWTEPKLPAPRPNDRQWVIAALKQAVEMWRIEKSGDYFCGDAAYQHWLNWLTGIDSGRVADPQAGMQGNGWCFDVLIHCRRIAGKWLTQQAAQFDGPAHAQLLIAADHYSQLANTCMADLDCPWTLAPHPDRFAAWTPAMRADQIARLTTARDHDAAAVAAIHDAISDPRTGSHP